jgi:4-hydroxy-tetrahydrodipicolinate reductase
MVPVAFVDGLATLDKQDELPVYTDPALCFAEKSPDVVIDFTNASWTPTLCESALSAGVRPVVGTSGLPASFMEWLGRESAERKLGAVVAANFAIGAVLMMHFATQAARFFESAEIIEMHHDQKVDSPSGTAIATAQAMEAARASVMKLRHSEKETLPGARGAESGGIAIHSVRLQGFVASQEIIFGGQGQTMTLRHDTTGRDSFMPGIVQATRRVMELDGLVVGLDRLMGLGDATA